MTRSAKLVLAGAAVLVLAVLGMRMYFGESSGPGVAGPTPSPTPSAAPTATPVVSQAPAASQQPSPTASRPPSGDTVLPGTYALRPEPYSPEFPRVMVTVPAGYQAIGRGPYTYAFVKMGDEPTDFSGLGVWVVDAVYEDPCRWAATDVDNQSLGPEVDDFVTAVTAQPGRIVEGMGGHRVDDVTVDGYNGKRFKTRVNYDIDAFELYGGFTECTDGEYRSWPGRFHQAPFQIDDVRVLDVDGTRLIIATTYFDGQDFDFDPPLATTSAQDRAELEAMFESIDIQVP